MGLGASSSGVRGWGGKGGVSMGGVHTHTWEAGASSSGDISV